MGNKKLLLISVMFLLFITLITANDYGYDNRGLPSLIPGINYSIKNVNSSEFWDNLDTPSDIDYSDFGMGFWDANVDLGAYTLTANRITDGTAHMTGGNVVVNNLQKPGALPTTCIDFETAIMPIFPLGLATDEIRDSTGSYIIDTSGIEWTLNTRLKATYFILDDNAKARYGTAIDAAIYYNGVNLIIDPDEVGTGKVYIGATGDDDLVANDGTFAGTGTFGYINIIDEANGYQVDGTRILSNEGTNNIFIGADTGASLTTGSTLILIGKGAGDAITEASNNICIGVDAGGAVTTGGQSIYIGKSAGASVTIGNTNMIIGYQAGRLLTGSYNTFIGYRAGYDCTTGSSNYFIGYEAGANVIGGGGNLFIGMSAGDTVTTGGYSTILGYAADAHADADSIIALGTFAIATADHQLVIGGDGSSNRGYVNDGYLGRGVTSATANNFTLQPTGGSGTDMAGNNFIIAGGKATGNAAGGSIIFATSDAGASGTTLQSLSNKTTINNLGNWDFGSGTLITTGIIQAGDYYSGDGSQGITDTFIARDGEIITIKDGLITNIEASV